MITLKAHYGAAIETAIGKAKAMRDRATVAASDGGRGLCVPSPRRHRLGRHRSNRREPPARHQAAGRHRRSRELITRSGAPDRTQQGVLLSGAARS